MVEITGSDSKFEMVEIAGGVGGSVSAVLCSFHLRTMTTRTITGSTNATSIGMIISAKHVYKQN